MFLRDEKLKNHFAFCFHVTSSTANQQSTRIPFLGTRANEVATCVLKLVTKVVISINGFDGTIVTFKVKSAQSKH
jgi:hypothetical protein